MIREALEYVVNLSKPSIVPVGNRIYKREGLTLMTEPVLDEPIKVSTLEAIVTFLADDTDEILSEDGIIIHVKDYDQVDVFGEANYDKQRNLYLHAEAICPTPIRYGNYYDTEDFNVLLQSRFEDNPHKALLLQLTGNVKDEAVKQIGDDGVKQSVTVKTGVTTVSDVIVPNPVVLLPRRTFFEIAQPESPFIFRMANGPTCALFESDGGAWRQEAMCAIAAYLSDQLSAVLDAGTLQRVKIIA